MITFHVERWEQYWKDAEKLWPLHWAEIALDQDSIKLDVDFAGYAELDSKKLLLIVTARDGPGPAPDGNLVGYHLSFLKPHLHYRTSLTAYVDIFYMHPDYRKGMTAVKMFRAVEEEMRKIGVQKIYTGAKVHFDLSPLFKRLGYRHIENVYSKLLG